MRCDAEMLAKGKWVKVPMSPRVSMRSPRENPYAQHEIQVRVHYQTQGVRHLFCCSLSDGCVGCLQRILQCLHGLAVVAGSQEMQREAMAKASGKQLGRGGALQTVDKDVNDKMELVCCGLCLPAQLEWWKTGNFEVRD